MEALLTKPPDPGQDVEDKILAKLVRRFKEEEMIGHECLVGLYDDKNIIGTGAFGEVRKVAWRKTPVAAKITKTELTETEKALFLRECDVMTRCRHPNIVQFLGYVDTPFVIVMEWLPMGDLKAYWKSRRLSTKHKIRICIDVLRALAYLHNRKPSAIIHRDIKPTNVLMTKSGVAKLTDFGLGRFVLDGSKHGSHAWALAPVRSRSPPPAVRGPSQAKAAAPRPSIEGGASDATATPEPSDDSHANTPIISPTPTPRRPPKGGGAANQTAVVGTVPYMAPEANLSNYDAKLDIYSAAVTFYELFEQQHFDESLPFGWALTPTKVRQLIKEMGSNDPEDRPCALELIDLFGALVPEKGSVACSIC